MAKARPITGLDSQAPTTRNARIILQQRLDDLYAYAPYTSNPDNVRELHDLRIAAKRLRYTLELFEEFLPTESKGFTEELARLQDELGALHDSEVMLALLQQLLQPEHQEDTISSTDETSAEAKSALLSPELTRTVLHSSNNSSALSTKERQGLTSFLHRQEQRREQSYALFHQHWQELERDHFREAVLKMLANNW